MGKLCFVKNIYQCPRLVFLCVEGKVDEVVVAGPVDEVLPLHDDVAVHPRVHVRLHGPKIHNETFSKFNFVDV